VEHQAELVRVLVVDDEPSIVDVISMALRHHGFGVEAAATGKQALDQVRRWRPHVMVLDVMLPDMEGFEVARRLSAEHADVPILFLSARDATADKVRGLTTGGDDYVTKPIEVTVRADDERAVLEVRDHGPGLPADAGDRVFERFWRTEGGRARGRGGAGLGLAIVKAIVQAHHGEVHAGNAPDGGAVFTVTLPIVQAAKRAGLPEEPATRA
jgi:two-component system OmpR family response regulator